MALGERAGANIGTSDTGLLSTPMPALHWDGPVDTLVKRLARQAKIKARRLGPDAWQLSRAPSRQPALVPRQAAASIIVVQGAKRPQSLLDDPVDVARVAGSELTQFGGIPNTRAISDHVPTLVSTDWGDGHDKLFLRGVADSSFLGASPSLVGQYLGDQRLTYSGPDPDLRLYDVASVEVMQGPQATLYGANALGGLIRIEPNAPALDAFAGSVWSGGTHSAHGGSGADAGAIFNVPIVQDRLAVRLVGYTALDPGYIDDGERNLKNVNRTRTRGGRASLRWRVNDRWTIDLIGVGQGIDNRDAPYADVGARPLTRSSSTAQPSYSRFYSGGIVIAGRLAGAMLRATTGLVEQSYGERFEVLQPYYSLLFVGHDRSTLVTQEVRLSNAFARGNWVFGVDGLWNVDREERQFGFIGAPAPLAKIRNEARDLTGYGEVTYRIAGPLSATVGARYSAEHLFGAAVDSQRPFFSLYSQVARVQAVRSEHHVRPSAALSVKFGGNAIAFVRYESGFRPGGLTAGAAIRRFEGDRIRTTEIGIRRGAAAGDQLAFSLIGASSRWSHIQADQLDGLGLPYVANIGDGLIHSLDTSIAFRPGRGWQIEASGFLAEGRLHPSAGFAVDNNATDLPNVAHNGATISLNYGAHLSPGMSWRASIRLRHVGHSLFTIGTPATPMQGGYTTLALGGGLTLRGLDITLDASNLLDSRADAFAVGTPFAGFVRQQITPLRPRALRLGMRYAF